jgi:hypothetical protein
MAGKPASIVSPYTRQVAADPCAGAARAAKGDRGRLVQPLQHTAYMAAADDVHAGNGGELLDLRVAADGDDDDDAGDGDRAAALDLEIAADRGGRA